MNAGFGFKGFGQSQRSRLVQGEHGIEPQPCKECAVVTDSQQRTSIATERLNELADAADITTNIVIDVVDPLHATGTSYFTFYFAGEGYTLPSPFDGPMAVGKYDDQFVCIDGVWKFSSRTMANRFQVGSLASYGLVDGVADDPQQRVS